MLSSSESDVRSERIIFLVASVPAWIVATVFVSLTVLSILRRDSLEDVFYATAMTTSFVAVSIYLLNRAMISQPLRLYETGVDNFREGLRLKFRPFSEIESIEIDIGPGGAIVRFWAQGRRRRFFNTLSLTKEDVKEEELKVAVEILRFKGVEMRLEGRAKSWLG